MNTENNYFYLQLIYNVYNYPYINYVNYQSMVDKVYFSIYSTVPLLGYLPQEMIGVSIFDFYHNDELSELFYIYQKGGYSGRNFL